MIPPGFIQDLLSRVDIVDIVGRHVDLKKAGINHKGLCPFHGEKSPSFTVSPSRQTYHCFGCGQHGNAVGFLMEHLGIGFIDAVKDLAQQAGMQVPEDDRSPQDREREKAQKQRQATLTEVLAKAGQHYRQQLKGNPRAIEYLKGRGLTGQIALQFGLGYAPDGWRSLANAFPSYDDPLLVETGMVILQDDPGKSEAEQRRYDRFRDRVMFPIRNVLGEVIGFGGRVLDKGEPKYLNSPETPVFHKGRELYGLYEARPQMRRRGYALVVEGYMDVVALAQHGFGNAVATLGTACTAEHVQKLFRFTESVVFSFDGDAAGRRAAGRALEAALPHANETRTIRFLFLPTEHDPDSYVRELGAEAFERCVEGAVPLSRQLMDTAADGCDLATPEGRAKMLSVAKPLWAALPDGLLKRQLLGELARRAQLPDAELQGLWANAQPPAAPGSRPRVEKPVAAPPRTPPGTPHKAPPRTSAASASSGEGPHDEPYFDIPASAYGDESQVGADDFHLPPDAYGAGGGAAPAPQAQGQGQPERKWVPKGEYKGKGGKGDWRKRDQDPTIGMPMPAPPARTVQAMRLLILHPELWNALSDQDLQLLHELDGEHGQMVAWLERFVVDHGTAPWAVMQVALEESGLTELAQRVCGGSLSAPPPNDAVESEFRQVMRNLWKLRLQDEAQRLAKSPNPDVRKYMDLQRQIKDLESS